MRVARRVRISVLAAIVLAATFAAGGVGGAATPPPGPVLHPPDRPTHTAFVVEVNHLGQVSRVVSRKGSGFADFDGMLLGNVVQTFVRRPNGHSVPGTYTINYDYNPKTGNIRRTADLIHAGGVDASAPGLVDRMAAANRQSLERLKKFQEEQAKLHPRPASSARPAPKPS